jgi:hypothetical protein
VTLPPLLIALVSRVTTNEVSPSELAQVAGALQRQGLENLLPAWSHALAVVQPCPDPHRVPFGYWPIYVDGDIGEPGAAGYHTDFQGEPYSLVQLADDWPFTASHEFLEMATDPFGMRLYRAPTPDLTVPSHPVQILLELGDPVEAYSYSLNGVQLSDFILHQYGNGRSGPYDFLGVLDHAREVADGGYISWREPDGEWKQITNFGGPEVISLGQKPAADTRSYREWVSAVSGR